MKHSSKQILGAAIVLVVGYVATAKLGLHYATVTRSVTLVWPPAGIALAFAFLFGSRIWPAIALAAFVANATTPGMPLYGAALIASGNVCEAILGAHLLARAGFDPSIRRLIDVGRLVFWGAILSTTVSALIGTSTLWLLGHVTSATVGRAAIVWWLGDLMGDLIVAPVLLTWLAMPSWRTSLARLLESAVWLVALVLVSLIAFGEIRVDEAGHASQSYAVFPIMIWAALRFGPRGATVANLVVTGIAIYATVKGHQSPFARGSLNASLVLLESFVVTVAVTSLLLAATTAERDEAVELREDFISIASHELRTPLTPLQLRVQSLRRSLGRHRPLGPEELDGALALLDRQVHRLVVVVEQLLDVTRIRGKRLVLEPSNVDLVTIVRESISTLQDAPQPDLAEISIDGPDSVIGTWDEPRIRQVVTNLLSNALKYGRGGPIKVELAERSGIAVLSVRDRGIGIEPRAREAIFERFGRATAARSYAGLGLGLYIANEVIRAHGGKMRVESDVGVGSKFIVEIPLAPRTADAESALTAPNGMSDDGSVSNRTGS